jgi:hypothetical protein
VGIPVLLKQHGLAQWTLGGTIVQNAAHRLLLMYQHSAEAVLNKLQVIELRPSKQVLIVSRNGELHFVPQLEIIGWVPRRDDVFGPRTVPMPVPILERAPASSQLSGSTPANDNPIVQASSSSPAEVTNGGVAAQPASTPAAVPPPANDAARIANDLFAEMTPAPASLGRPPF